MQRQDGKENDSPDYDDPGFACLLNVYPFLYLSKGPVEQNRRVAHLLVDALLIQAVPDEPGLPELTPGGSDGLGGPLCLVSQSSRILNLSVGPGCLFSQTLELIRDTLTQCERVTTPLVTGFAGRFDESYRRMLDSMIVVTGSTHQDSGPVERQAVWAPCQFLHRPRMTISTDKGPVGDALRRGDREDSVKPVTVRAHSVRTTGIPVDTCLEVLPRTRVAVAAHRRDPSAWNSIGFFPMTSFAIYDRVRARLEFRIGIRWERLQTRNAGRISHDQKHGQKDQPIHSTASPESATACGIPFESKW